LGIVKKDQGKSGYHWAKIEKRRERVTIIGRVRKDIAFPIRTRQD
jgi:hypothetical protein